ncbi:hypothetical protein CPI83_27065 [Rhodococcus sp. H-CA8f]|nr:hypothetical protein [Rhodococcus sp. H-CA8f]ATI35320.1 hypothetical protein CPI83_27065 [Rhodococcus sp. H-CA8f]
MIGAAAPRTDDQWTRMICSSWEAPEHVGGHVYAAAAANDPVPMIGDVFGGLSHGANPANDLPLIGFGATVIESAPGTGIDAGLLGELPSPVAHSEY